ncbi:MAG: GerMN domain-containing protein [Clostridiales bacterium]|nr:GerMN domain-containing protein [Clostridiales bacterium]
MKKIITLIITILVFIIFVGACNRKQSSNNDEQSIEEPSPTDTVPIVTITPTDVPDNNISDGVSILEYYPFKMNTKYIYKGIGNEYASYTVYNDFIDEGLGRIQTRTNNGGTETVRVLEYKDGELKIILRRDECYYRDNLIDKESSEEGEILLKEPLIEGSKWLLPDGRERSISNLEASVETESITYDAIEITTEGEGGITKDYYAKGLGLVKSVFLGDGVEIYSILDEIQEDVPLVQQVEFYYPDQDEKIYKEIRELAFNTNEATRLVVQEVMKEEVQKKTYLPLNGPNTKINSLYLREDNIVYIDFSEEFISEMNAGSGYEALILQSITNTLGNYYGVEEVYITVEGKPYESGHEVKEEGETFKVNMDNVVE